MRLIQALTLSAALALPLAAPVLAEGGVATITVTGTGTVQAVPDMATLTLGVTTQGDTAAVALAANSEAVAAVIARLTASGVEARDMQTSNLSINPNWTSFDSSSSPTISGYVATNMLTVRVRVLEGLGDVLDAAVADGANTLNGLTFGMAAPEPALNEARKAAVADARAKAELLVAAAGQNLGRVVTITEGGAWTDPAPMFRDSAAASPPVAGGEVAMTANVTIQYEMTE
jgi:uncharacterized protein YggE